MHPPVIQDTRILVLADGSSASDIANARGHLFEHFAARILAQSGFEEPSLASLNVSQSGIELDIVLKHKVSGVIALAECKAYADPVPAKELVAFYGKLHARRLADGRVDGYLFALPRLSRSGAD